MEKPPATKEPKTHAEAARQRKDIASGEIMDDARLIRFVAAPDGALAPDLGRKLPGRGLWVQATPEAIEIALKKGLFAKAARAKVTPPDDLVGLIRGQLEARCLDRLGLARRAGALAVGFEGVLSAAGSGRAAWLVEASDGAADGRRKLLAAGRRAAKAPRLCGAFNSDELSLALGLGNVIHVALLAGRWAERWTEEVERLGAFRPLLPASWGEEA
jgi:predicted RNA-binding protein YlxR (DUF448 family)